MCQLLTTVHQLLAKVPLHCGMLTVGKSYGLNCFPQIHSWSPTYERRNLLVGLWEVIRSGWRHESGVLKVRLVPQWEKTRELFLSHPFPHLSPFFSLFLSKIEQESGQMQARKWAFTRNQICWHLDAGFHSVPNCEK